MDATGSDAIRGAHGRSLNVGVSADTLPVRNDLQAVPRGTTLAAAHSIANEGLSRAVRVHIHLFDVNRMGAALYTQCRFKNTMDVIIAIDARELIDGGV